MTEIRSTYLEAARIVPAVVEAAAPLWGQPSSLEGWTVGGLVGHFVRGVGQVVRYLDMVTPPRGPQQDAVDYFETFGLRAEDFAKEIIQRGDEEAADGPDAVAARVGAWLERLEVELQELPPGYRVAVLDAYATTIDEYLRTRLVELVVHHADLAVTVDVPEMPSTARTEALGVLVALARRKHGDRAVIESLTRNERAVPLSVF